MTDPRSIDLIKPWLPALLVVVAVATARAADAPCGSNARPRRSASAENPLHQVPWAGQAQGETEPLGSQIAARGGESGPVIEPGSPEESALWDRVATAEMPPKPEEPLSVAEKALIRRWIELGAKGLPRSQDLGGSTPEADHWAYGPIVIPIPPVPRDSSRVRTAVDRFVQVRSRGTGARARCRGRSGDLDSPAQLRPDRPAANP